MFLVSEFERKRQGRFGDPLYYFEQLESTNETAGQLARDGCPEGAVVLANEQTRGRGRKNNPWYSPADKNLYFSLILRPDVSILKFLPYTACLAVLQAMSQIGLQGDFKWPNDIVVRDRKLCGILIQTAMEDQQLQHVVLGCGINVNLEELPPDLRDTATSLVIETGSEQVREALLASVLLAFERLYEKIDPAAWTDFSGGLERASTYLRGCEVRILQDGETLEGITQGLDSFGGLRVLTAAGEKSVYAGEVISCRRK